MTNIDATVYGGRGKEGHTQRPPEIPAHSQSLPSAALPNTQPRRRVSPASHLDHSDFTLRSQLRTVQASDPSPPAAPTPPPTALPGAHAGVGCAGSSGCCGSRGSPGVLFAGRLAWEAPPRAQLAACPGGCTRKQPQGPARASALVPPAFPRGRGWGLIVSAAPEHTGNKWVWKGETPQIFLKAVGSRQKISGRSCWAPKPGGPGLLLPGEAPAQAGWLRGLTWLGLTARWSLAGWQILMTWFTSHWLSPVPG